MDLNSRFAVLMLFFASCVISSLGEVQSDSSNNNDDFDEFNVFVQTFLAHLLNSDVFTKAEKEDLKSIVYTVETVITAPRRRETDIVRKMQIFNVAVVSTIAETIGVESDGGSSENTKRKASAIARALTSAFNTVSADSSNNELLISEINNMVNMFARLEHQEGLDLDTLNLPSVLKQPENVGTKNESALPKGNEQEIPANGYADDNVQVMNERPLDMQQNPPLTGDSAEESNKNVPVETPSRKEALSNQPTILSAPTDGIQVNENEETVSHPPDPGESTDWNFVFCLYNELFTSTVFSEVFSNNLPQQATQTYMQRISSDLAKTLFQARMSEYDIFSSLSTALQYLSPTPTTEEFAFMFGHELSKMLYNQGMFYQYGPCEISSSVASIIIESIKTPTPPKAPSDSSSLENPLADNKPPFSNTTTASSDNNLDTKKQTDFQPRLFNRLLSSEIFRTAFPEKVTNAKLRDYAYAVGSFIPAIPEYKTLNHSVLSAAISDTLQFVHSLASTDKYAEALASVITTFVEKNHLLDEKNLDKQVARIGTIVLNALSTQIPAKTPMTARKLSEQPKPRNRSPPDIKKKEREITPVVNRTNGSPSIQKKLPDSVTGANLGASRLKVAKDLPESLPLSTTNANDNAQLHTTTEATILDESYDSVSEETETDNPFQTESTRTDNDVSATDAQNLDLVESSTNATITTTEQSDIDQPHDETSTVAEPETTTGVTINSSTDPSALDEVTTDDDNSTPFSEGFFELATATMEEEEAAIKQLEEEIHRAEQSGTTETLVRALAAVVTEAYNNQILETTAAESIETTTEISAEITDDEYDDETSDLYTATETTTTDFKETETDSTIQTSSVPSTTVGTSLSNLSTEIDENSVDTSSPPTNLITTVVTPLSNSETEIGEGDAETSTMPSTTVGTLPSNSPTEIDKTNVETSSMPSTTVGTLPSNSPTEIDESDVETSSIPSTTVGTSPSNSPTEYDESDVETSSIPSTTVGTSPSNSPTENDESDVETSSIPSTTVGTSPSNSPTENDESDVETSSIPSTTVGTSFLDSSTEIDKSNVENSSIPSTTVGTSSSNSPTEIDKNVETSSIPSTTVISSPSNSPTVTDKSNIKSSSAPSTIVGTLLSILSPEVTTYSTTPPDNSPKSKKSANELGSNTRVSRERRKKSLADKSGNPLIEKKPSKKSRAPLVKSPSWLFECALSYSLLSSEKFTAAFKPETTATDAKALAFTMAESVAKVPPLDFPDSVFVLGHAYYNAAQQMTPNSTAEDYAKAFANATAEIALEKDLLTRENQIPVAIGAGNAIDSSLSDGQSAGNAKSYLNKIVKPKPFELGDDASTSAFLEELLSTLSNGDTDKKQELLSQTLSDIGTVLGNKHLKPKTILIKLLMEALVAAVNVIISDSSE